MNQTGEKSEIEKETLAKKHNSKLIFRRKFCFLRY